MNTILKNLPRLFTILFLLTLCGCGVTPAKDTNTENSPVSMLSASTSSGSAISSETSENPDAERRKQVQLEINSDSHNKILIPDPATITEDVVKISLQTEAEDDDDLWDYETDEEFTAKCQNRYGADLSFAGLGDNVMISSYVVGNMTDPDSNAKNCLALFVHENPETEQEKNYFLVLDYGQGNYYLTETPYFLHHWSHWVDLETRDLTGDGIQELVFSHIYNKSINVGVFRCDEQSHTLIPLFSTKDDYDEEERDFLDRTWFQGHLEDDYKVVLEFPEINYSKIVSMIDDGGYSREQLQVGSKEPYGGINFVALWKDGKLQKEKVDADTVFLYTLDHVDYPIGKNGKPQLELVRGIYIGHRSKGIGNMHIFLQYDPGLDRLTLKNAKYVDSKQASKEWDNFDEWDEE